MEERKGFGTNFGFLMAAVGSAVGLGNIWGFPNKMGASGGFTFLIIYLILAVLCGFIVMVGELAIGRKTGHGAVGAYKALSKKFKWMGWLGILSAFFILFFYCALGLLHQVHRSEHRRSVRCRLRLQWPVRRRNFRQLPGQSR